MPPDRAERVAEIVEEALDRPTDVRPAFLDSACAEDALLRHEVESLLGFRRRAERFIEEPAFRIAPELLEEDVVGLAPGEMLGSYRVLSLLGEGGMGEVYLAEDTELHRRVALKLIKRGVSTSRLLRQFRREERILAALSHPNIARLYGVGAAPDGLPYFVMEYIEGERLDTSCDLRHLGMRERLDLFRKICAAVAYAHAHLVIHRDIKPANIRLTPEGEPKLLDFGIAKLLDDGNADVLEHTMTLPGVMTPDYASPEQVRGESVTTASDIYSLGVVLYELLTGAKPFKTESTPAAEMSRAIAERTPTRPSTAVPVKWRAKLRDAKSLRGDLDNVILMAMRHEPARRYASVAQFSEDIRRYIDGMPVIARKDTWRYRAGKFVRRNKLAVAAAAVVFLTLVGGIVATTKQAKIANAERDRARREAAKAERVTTFLQNVLGFSDPGWASANPNRNREATISEAMVEAGRRAESELANEPEALAAVHFTIGASYRVQGRFLEAEPHLRRALEIRRRVLGNRSVETGQSIVALAEWCVLNGRLPEANELFPEALPIIRAVHDVKWLSIALNDYGVLKAATGDNAGAEKLLREGLRVSAALKGADRAPRAMMFSALGAARRDQGDLIEGAAFLQKSIEEHRALPGEPRSEMAFALQNLAGIRLLESNYEEAESLLREAAELFRKTLGANHQSSALPLMTLAELYYRRGDYAKARTEIENAIQIQEKALPADHIDRTWSRLTVGKISMRTGALGEADVTLRSVTARLEQLYPQDHPGLAAARGALGECLVLQKRYPEAEPLLLESHKVFQARVGAGDARTKSAAARLMKLYEAWEKPAEAAKYRP